MENESNRLENDSKKLEKEYEMFNKQGEAVDYLLGIMADCRELNPPGAKEKLRDLELLFRTEHAREDLISKLNKANKILEDLPSYIMNHGEYMQCFNKLKRTLAEIQENFSDWYKESA